MLQVMDLSSSQELMGRPKIGQHLRVQTKKKSCNSLIKCVVLNYKCLM